MMRDNGMWINRVEFKGDPCGVLIEFRTCEEEGEEDYIFIIESCFDGDVRNVYLCSGREDVSRTLNQAIRDLTEGEGVVVDWSSDKRIHVVQTHNWRWT